MMSPNVKRQDGSATSEQAGKWATYPLVWRRITYSLVLHGYLAMASTGEIHAVASGLFLMGWGIGFWLTRRPPWWRDWMSPVLIWLTLGVIGMLVLRGRIDSLWYLLLFLGLFKCLTLKEPVDHLHAILMAFFMLLACSIITTSLLFVVFLLVFLVLVTIDLILLTIIKEAIHYQRPGADGRAAESGPTTPVRVDFIGRMIMSSLVVGTIVLVISFALFFIMPHYEPPNLTKPLFGRSENQEQSVSAYSDEVKLEPVRNIQLDNTEVMTVGVGWPVDNNEAMTVGAGWPEVTALEARWRQAWRKAPLPTQLRLRGEALAYYDEEQWRKHPNALEYSSSLWTEIALPHLSVFRRPLLQYAIQGQKLGLTTRIFSPGHGGTFQFFNGRSRKLIYNQSAQSLRVSFTTRSLIRPSAFTGEFHYAVSSGGGREHSQDLRRLVAEREEIAEENARHAKRPGLMPFTETIKNFTRGALSPKTHLSMWMDPALEMPITERRIYTQLPRTQLTRKLEEISRRQATAPTAEGKTVQLVDWLRSDFEYSLELDNSSRMHPIESFLTRSRKGHCEYFASSLALLLRAQGVPTRVVSGFYTSDYAMGSNGRSRRFTVKQSDAHAWTEVWLDRLGWMTIDPTPPQHRGRAAQASMKVWWGERMTNRVRGAWQRYVLDYSVTQRHQMVNAFLTSKFSRMIERVFRPVAGLLPDGMSLRSRPGADNRGLGVVFYYAGLVLLFALLLLILVYYRRSRRIRLLQEAMRSPVFFMNPLIDRLEGLGWRRGPSQTPAEWISRIDRETGGRFDLQWLLELYHRCRFAQIPPTAEEHARANHLLRQICRGRPARP